MLDTNATTEQLKNELSTIKPGESRSMEDCSARWQRVHEIEAELMRRGELKPVFYSV